MNNSEATPAPTAVKKDAQRPRANRSSSNKKNHQQALARRQNFQPKLLVEENAEHKRALVKITRNTGTR